MADVAQSQIEEALKTYIDPYLEADLVSSKAVDRKSTRLNSSHRCISYAVFCLKKKTKKTKKKNKKKTKKNKRILWATKHIHIMT